MHDLAEMFRPGGLLARNLSGFTHRDAQEEMARLVWDALASQDHLAIEAGTGIGKTFAYLVPVLLSGKRAVISTGTRTLQDQLYDRDLPMLGAAIGRPVEIALLKGRNNYLCWHRLEVARQEGIRSGTFQRRLAAISEWARSADSGDLTDLADIAEDDPLRTRITSTVDNCLGARCEHYDNCFVIEARRRAQTADVVIVNHHLLLADLTLKEAGFGELLPGTDVVVVDEAHQLPDIAQQFFGISVGSRELQRLSRDVIAEARATGLDREFESLADRLVKRSADARLEAGEQTGRAPWDGCPAGLQDAVMGWRETLNELATRLEAAREISPGLESCWERCRDAVSRLNTLDEADPRGLRWVDVAARSLAIHWTPLETGEELAQRIEAHAGTWIFTSATLAVGEDFSHFVERIGVKDTLTKALPSPFDFESNSRLYLPEGLPQPTEPEFVSRLLGEVYPLVKACGGGAFLLFTSYRALNEAQRLLSARELPGPLLVQGDGPRTELLERFRSAGNAVLLGTGSFWQGVDVRGPALRLVAIDKLPFASPGDPLIRARIDSIRGEGGDPFFQFQVPQAALALKQGVGRLIRDFDDRGLVVLGDPRLRTRSYGKTFIDSLPAIPIVESADDALSFAQDLLPNSDLGYEAAGR
ncbi:MAG: ATP-dependent DNA helicase [Candidatus Rariloculaceae bacterium]